MSFQRGVPIATIALLSALLTSASCASTADSTTTKDQGANDFAVSPTRRDNHRINNIDDFVAAVSDAKKNKSFRAVADLPTKKLRMNLVLGAGVDRLEGTYDGGRLVALQSSSLIYVKFKQIPGVDAATSKEFLERCLRGRWISTPYSDPIVRDFWDLTNVARASLGQSADSSSLPRRGSPRTIGGVEATSWRFSSGEVLWVQRYGPALPLLLELEGGTIRYSDFKSPAEEIALPAPQEVLAKTDIDAGRC